MTWFHPNKNEWHHTDGTIKRKMLYDGDDVHAIFYAHDTYGRQLGATHSLKEAKDMVEGSYWR